MEQCPICRERITCHPLGTRDAYAVDCPRCGIYHITRTALVNLGNTHLSDRQVANISGWLKENPIFEIMSSSEAFLEQLNTPSFHERSDKFLKYLEKETDFAGQTLVADRSWLSSGWCINYSELEEIISYLRETERIEASGNLSEKRIKIRPAGWAYLENLKKVNSDQKQGFVAMWFSNEMNHIFESVIAKAIINAGYLPHRVDLREHNDKIDDEIIAQIRKSRFLFADFTGQRGGVYFEAGYAKGLGLEVFWSCREDDISNLHFDIRQYNCITWNQERLEEYKKKITNRVEAVIGHGPYQASKL